MLDFLKSLLSSIKVLPKDNIKTWGYYINGTDASVVSNAPYDLMVIDTKNQDGQCFTEHDVAYMCRKSKYMVAYISLGEAEDYRDYWKPAWKKVKPVWLGPENPEWKGNYSVKQFWHPDWWDITAKILDDVMIQGFGGVYIDKIDVYDDLGGTADLREKMIKYIMNVSKYCKAKNPNFLIIAQNAEELGTDPRYMAAVDGIGKESLFYSGELGKEQKPNRALDINNSVDLLNLFKAAGKLVLCVEYVPDRLWHQVRQRISAIGFIPYCGPKLLDKLTMLV